MSRGYWLKFGGCVVFLLFVGISMTNHDSFASFGWPWQGLLEIASAIAELLSPFVFIYFVILASRLK